MQRGSFWRRASRRSHPDGQEYRHPNDTREAQCAEEVRSEVAAGARSWSGWRRGCIIEEALEGEARDAFGAPLLRPGGAAPCSVYRNGYRTVSGLNSRRGAI